ncbi:hypothetical protein EDC04DRAFT_1459445 [Pisolithus marmoratus]|nr:hypothetical protein EDC04DRAFT_1459445 [Pisolithus marmoratus]
MFTSAVSNSSYSKHLEFYTHTVTFLVEDCLFRIPREPLEAESIVFRDMFRLPQGDPETVEGLSDTRPVILQGVSKKEFESLLRALMCRQHGTHRGSDLDHDQWISVLKLSTMWEFDELRNAAIQYLDPSSQRLHPVDKFVLALQYDIKKWLLPTLLELAARAEPINTEEGHRIGLENVVKLAAVREDIEKLKVIDVLLRDFTLKPRAERVIQSAEDKEELHRLCVSLVTKAFDL